MQFNGHCRFGYARKLPCFVWNLCTATTYGVWPCEQQRIIWSKLAISWQKNVTAIFSSADSFIIFASVLIFCSNFHHFVWFVSTLVIRFFLLIWNKYCDWFQLENVHQNHKWKMVSYFRIPLWPNHLNNWNRLDPIGRNPPHPPKSTYSLNRNR